MKGDPGINTKDGIINKLFIYCALGTEEIMKIHLLFTGLQKGAASIGNIYSIQVDKLANLAVLLAQTFTNLKK